MRLYYFFSKEHTEIYKAAYKIFLDNKVLGAGVKNFRNFVMMKDTILIEIHVQITHTTHIYKY